MEKTIRYITKPLFLFLTALAIVGFLVQLFAPNLYFSSQEALRETVSAYQPYDVPAFIGLQIFQVIIAPVSHYVVSILGGALYGQWWGGIYNWIGRMIGHIAAYWLGRTIGTKIISYVFNESDLDQYKRFVNGSKRTLYIRAIILFLMIFLPLFPDDEISYLVGLAAFDFRLYLMILALGHLGGSFALAYAGAGIQANDPYFWFLTVVTIGLAVALIFYVKKLGRMASAEGE